MTQALEDLRNQHDEQVKLYKMELEQTYQAKVTAALPDRNSGWGEKTISISLTVFKETSCYNMKNLCPSVQMPPGACVQMDFQ